MVCADRVRRVVAVVGGQDHEVAVAQFAFERHQVRVELLECAGVAGDVAAVAVQHVKVDQVDEHEPRLDGFGELDRVLHAVAVAFGVHRLRDAAAGEDVFDLADPDDGDARGFQAVEAGRHRRLH